MTPIAIGAVLGVLLVARLRRHPPEAELRGYAVGLVVAALIYLAFALRSPSAAWLLAEAGGVAGFSLAAWLGVVRSPLWVAAGWIVHVAWDLALHGAGGPAFVPEWYPLLCTGFDPVVAAAVVWNTRRRRAAATGSSADRAAPAASVRGGAGGPVAD